MDLATAEKLNAINRAFYAQGAGAFSATREAPWPGWLRLLPPLREGAAERGLAVLDVGCGNGRFARFLAEQLPERRERIDYLGLDASPEMLALAGAQPPALGRLAFERIDLVEEGLADRLGGRRFDLAVLFGVLHHVPGAERRRSLLADLAGLLAPGGLLAVTAWQFQAFARFRDKCVPWSEYNRHAAAPVDPAELEEGDFLLPFGEGAGPLRYCSYTSEADVRALLSGLPLEERLSYTADGRGGDLNRYFVMRRPEAPS